MKVWKWYYFCHLSKNLSYSKEHPLTRMYDIKRTIFSIDFRHSLCKTHAHRAIYILLRYLSPIRNYSKWGVLGNSVNMIAIYVVSAVWLTRSNVTIYVLELTNSRGLRHHPLSMAKPRSRSYLTHTVVLLFLTRPFVGYTIRSWLGSFHI